MPSKPTERLVFIFFTTFTISIATSSSNWKLKLALVKKGRLKRSLPNSWDKSFCATPVKWPLNPSATTYSLSSKSRVFPFTTICSERFVSQNAFYDFPVSTWVNVTASNFIREIFPFFSFYQIRTFSRKLLIQCKYN